MSNPFTGSEGTYILGDDNLTHDRCPRQPPQAEDLSFWVSMIANIYAALSMYHNSFIPLAICSISAYESTAIISLGPECLQNNDK
jgi:hypothetical protein